MVGVTETFTVTAHDAYGNTATSYTGTVTFSSTDSQAFLPANYAFTTTDAGVHIFIATFKATGTQSITATDTVNALITGTQSGITVSPLAAPSGLTTRASGTGQLTLSWTDNSSNQDQFKIERSTDGLTYTQITTVTRKPV